MVTSLQNRCYLSSLSANSSFSITCLSRQVRENDEITHRASLPRSEQVIRDDQPAATPAEAAPELPGWFRRESRLRDAEPPPYPRALNRLEQFPSRARAPVEKT